MKTIRGFSKIYYLGSLIKKSDLLKKDLIYFVENTLELIIRNKYQLDLARYFGSISQKLNHLYGMAIKVPSKEVHYCSNSRIRVPKSHSILDQELKFCVQMVQNIQTNGFFKFPWSIEEIKRSKKMFLQMLIEEPYFKETSRSYVL